jgi:flavin-dependent dehydrogenase
MREYDVIVVGARCAGSPTAMLLARMGYDVLVVDRARFPSDTISTHLLHPPAVGALDDWGLLDRVIATGCPGIDTYAYDFGDVTIAGSPGLAYAPRRTLLDEILVQAASEAGAEVREGFAVDELLIEDGRVCGIRGQGARVRARVVVGRTVTTRASRPGSRRRATTRSRRSRSATTRTSAGCR